MGIWEPDGFRGRPGRPRQNWRGVISKDLKKIGIGWDDRGQLDGRRYRRRRSTREAGVFVSPNAPLTPDELGTRFQILGPETGSTDMDLDQSQNPVDCFLSTFPNIS